MAKFTLQLLGGLSLSGPDGQPLGRASQPRRLALLVLLSLAPRRTMSRDRLMALLWPECGMREARRNLSSALYDLRDALGHDALVSVNTSVSLNESVVGSDVDQLEAAIEDDRWDEAVACYAGPLLDGIYLVPEGDFERWVDGERQRLDRLYQRAVEAAALAAEARRPREASSLPDSLASDQSSPAPPSRRRIRLRLAGAGLAAVRCLPHMEPAPWAGYTRLESGSVSSFSRSDEYSSAPRSAADQPSAAESAPVERERAGAVHPDQLRDEQLRDRVALDDAPH